MMFVGLAVLWTGYTITWWGWCAVTGRVRGNWPSLTDLIVPGRSPAPPLGSGPPGGIPQTDIAHSVGAQPGYSTVPIGPALAPNPVAGSLVNPPAGTTFDPRSVPGNPIPYLPGLINPNP